MNELLAYVTVLVAAAIPWLEVLLVVPAGIVAGLPPAPTALVGAIGNLLTLIPLVLAGDRLRSWWTRRRERRSAPRPEDHRAPADAPTDTHTARDEDHAPDETGAAPDDASGARQTGSGRSRRAKRMAERYGLPGLAILGPLLTGIHVAAVAALAVGAERRRTLVWLSGGVVVWAAIAAAATVLGLDALVDPDALPDLLGAAASSGAAGR
jgi:uncharacterized membrane protein